MSAEDHLSTEDWSGSPGLASSQALHPLLADLLFSPPGEGFAESFLVELHDDRRGSVRSLGAAHPLDVLLGSRVSARCHGLAVVVEGQVRFSDHPSESFAVGRSVRSAQLVNRDGSAWGAVAVPPAAVGSGRGLDWGVGSTAAATPMLTDLDTDGAVVDALCCALGVASAPAELPVAWYWAVAWLADLVELNGWVSEGEIAAWHPAVDPREVSDLAGARLVDFVRQRHLDHATATGWAGVRHGAAAGWLDAGVCPATLASWFDDGAFSRWLADQLITPYELLDAIENLLDEPAKALVAGVVVDSLVPHSTQTAPGEEGHENGDVWH